MDILRRARPRGNLFPPSEFRNPARVALSSSSLAVVCHPALRKHCPHTAGQCHPFDDDPTYDFFLLAFLDPPGWHCQAAAWQWFAEITPSHCPAYYSGTVPPRRSRGSPADRAALREQIPRAHAKCLRQLRDVHDPNELAKLIVERTTNEDKESPDAPNA